MTYVTMDQDRRRRARRALYLCVGLVSLMYGRTGAVHADPSTIAATTLEQQLRAEPIGQLVQAVRQMGDPVRGALLFYQPQLGCAKCHVADPSGNRIGPDLARPPAPVTPHYLIESLLDPSKEIRDGFQTVTLILNDGTTVTGLCSQERDDAIVLRDSTRDFRLITIPRDRIEAISQTNASLMPTDLAGLVGTRQQFLDLVAYVLAVHEGGPEREEQLRPPQSLVSQPSVPAYEQNIDHPGLISRWDDASFQRGKAIYDRVCGNCHGTRDEEGSLPAARRFAHQPLKAGSDPYSMYRVLTYGFGQMLPQAWMVPQQKYDVIHYIRQAYLKPWNSSCYFPVDDAYLQGLPHGTDRGPDPAAIEPWIAMDYGPGLSATYEVGTDGTNIAYKGIAIRLDPGPGGISRGQHWILYEHDTLRVAGIWTGEGFIDWNSIHFNDRHEVHPRIVGQLELSNPTGPGWAYPETERFGDARLKGRDGRAYGPLPHSWAQFRGLYYFGPKVILSYRVGSTDVLEMPGLEIVDGTAIYTRTLNLGPRPHRLVLQVAHVPECNGQMQRIQSGDNELSSAVALPAASRAGSTATGKPLVVGVYPPSHATSFSLTPDGSLRLTIPAGNEPIRLVVWAARVDRMRVSTALVSKLRPGDWLMDLTPLTLGGPPRWPVRLSTEGTRGADEGPFAVDILTHPDNNPWFCRMRFSGFDFFPDGRRAAICTWDGDVWLVDGIDQPERGLVWQRIASGLFQPLGLKIVNQQIYVCCRDQIAILHDLNGDGETDFYECFNSDHQVTEHFHEFAMGLETDSHGNFYYAKAARHAKTALVPHHGTLLRVLPDGSSTEILATGFRAPNGVCINSDGTFFVSDQEGHWIPKNRINWVRKGGFYGNAWGYHNLTDVSDQAMEPPVCWITNRFDRSPAELLWCTSRTWGPLDGSLLCLSYGYGKIFVVPHERVAGVMQGGMCELPIPQFPTGVMRGRFSPADGQLYVCGMYAWASDRQQPGGFYRVRYTGQPVYVPVTLSATHEGLRIGFSGPLGPETAEDVQNYRVKTWTLRRTANYGSDHFNETTQCVASAKLLPDRRTVLLSVRDLVPTWCMEIQYHLTSADGQPIVGTIHNTIHHVPETNRDSR